MNCLNSPESRGISEAVCFDCSSKKSCKGCKTNEKDFLTYRNGKLYTTSEECL